MPGKQSLVGTSRSEGDQMTRTSLVGNGPVEVTTATGNLVAVPLSAFYLDDQGKPNGNGPLYKANKAALDARLNDLMAENLVGPATSPSPPPAVVLTATLEGE